MKKARQKKIIELIEKYKIDTQDELIKKLKENGFVATQATVSRDIKDLQLAKISDDQDGYYYVAPKSQRDSTPLKINASLAHLITSVDEAMNIVVVKTHAGMAQAVATAIDNINSTDILGCVAGDDTIFVLTVSPEAAKSTGVRISAMVAGTHK